MSNFMGGPGCTPPRRWDHPTHHPDADILDGDWGRYLVKRVSKGSRTFAIFLNGKRTGYAGTRERMKAQVERIIDTGARPGNAGEAFMVQPTPIPAWARSDLRLAVEWGYKQCEKGENLEGALRNFETLMGKPT